MKRFLQFIILVSYAAKITAPLQVQSKHSCTQHTYNECTENYSSKTSSCFLRSCLTLIIDREIVTVYTINEGNDSIPDNDSKCTTTTKSPSINLDEYKDKLTQSSDVKLLIW